MHDAETQTARKVHSDIGVQCELILPPAIALSSSSLVLMSEIIGSLIPTPAFVGVEVA